MILVRIWKRTALLNIACHRACTSLRLRKITDLRPQKTPEYSISSRKCHARCLYSKCMKDFGGLVGGFAKGVAFSGSRSGCDLLNSLWRQNTARSTRYSDTNDPEVWHLSLGPPNRIYQLLQSVRVVVLLVLVVSVSVLLVLVLSQGIEDFEAFGMEQCKKRHMQHQTLNPDQNIPKLPR